MLIDTGAKKLIAGIGMFVVVYLMNNIQVNSLVLVVAQVMVGAVVYGLLLVLLRDKWTCEIIKTVVRKGEK